MNLEILNTSVCVIAKEHNPTILHPAFLAAQGIVPDDWVIANPPICTPAFSIVQYTNGIVFNVESNKFVVTDGKPSTNAAESKVPELTLAYIEKLPHVRYTAVGVNLHGSVLCEDPENYIIRRFLKSGPWDSSGLGMTALGLRFLCTVEDAVLRIGCDGGMLRRDEQEQKTILVTGNFHSDLPEDGCLDALRSALGRWSDRCRVFGDSANVLLGLEDYQ